MIRATTQRVVLLLAVLSSFPVPEAHLVTDARGGGMADAADLKFVDRKGSSSEEHDYYSNWLRITRDLFDGKMLFLPVALREGKARYVKCHLLCLEPTLVFSTEGAKRLTIVVASSPTSTGLGTNI